jgi:hypothetical protein
VAGADGPRPLRVGTATLIYEIICGLHQIGGNRFLHGRLCHTALLWCIADDASCGTNEPRTVRIPAEWLTAVARSFGALLLNLRYSSGKAIIVVWVEEK